MQLLLASYLLSPLFFVDFAVFSVTLFLFFPIACKAGFFSYRVWGLCQKGVSISSVSVCVCVCVCVFFFFNLNIVSSSCDPFFFFGLGFG